MGKEQSLDNVKNDNKNNRIDKSQSDAIIDLLQIIVEKLYELKNAIDTLQTEVTLQKKEIKEINDFIKKSNNIIIVGEGGIGKTTMIRELSKELIKEDKP